MKRSRLRALALIAIAALIVGGLLAACTGPFDGESGLSVAETGSLSLTIGGEIHPLLRLEPQWSLDIASYKITGSITGSGVQGASFEEAVSRSGGNQLVSISGLAVGDWTIAVEAYNAANAEGQKIAEGSNSVTITAGAANTVTVTVAELTGDGTLKLDLEWPSELGSVTLTADLTQRRNTTGTLIGSPATVDLTDGNAPGSGGGQGDNEWNYQGDHAAGFYRLSLQLRGAAGNTYENDLIWGQMISVRMADGAETAGSLPLSLPEDGQDGDFNLGDVVGGLALTINDTTIGDTPFSVSLSEQQGTVLATVDPVGSAYSYEWFLMGIPVAGSAAELELGSTGLDLPSGSYTVSVVVGTATHEASAAARVSVLAQMYNVGDTGPAGGLVFYVDHENHFPWTYLEAAPVGWNGGEDPTAEWGVRGTAVEGARGIEIGSGSGNTAGIVAAHPDTGFAANVASEASINGYSDWFLPSLGELNAMREALYLAGVGGFAQARYWSSTECCDQNARYQNFSNGSQPTGGKNNLYRVRPVRAF